jgi:hypothetical protein
VVNPSTLIPFILASFFFIARIVAKSSGLAGGWGWDDYAVIVSYVGSLSDGLLFTINGFADPRSRDLRPQHL